MKLAADFRQAAREALRGKWPIAILIGLVAVLLGGAGSGGPEVKFNYDVSSGVSTTLTRLWKGLYILLGTILLVIPGLIMGYTYAMTDYILAEHPDMAPGEVMKTSKAMMEGNR